MHKLDKIFAWILVLFIALLCTAERQARANELSKLELRVNGIAFDVKGKEPVVPELLKPRTEKGVRKWIVQFDGPIREADKELLVELGCRLLDYLPDFAFLAAMDEDTKKAVTKLSFIRGAVRYKPAHKLPPKLREKAATAVEGEAVRLHLKLDDTANPLDLLPLIHRLGGKVLDVGRDTLRVAVDTTAIAELAALEEVTWINEHVDMHIFNDTTRWVIQTDLPNDLSIWENGLHGEGQIIGVGDTGLDYDMPWFRDPTGVPIGPGHRKIVGYDTTYGDDYDANSPGHGTHVCGTTAGDRMPVDGLSNANGMAPKVRLFIQDLTPGSSLYVYPPSDLGEMFNTAYTAGARLHTNSWGDNVNSYGPYASSADRFLWEHRDFLALFANGNNGPNSYTVSNPATAKNVISVGATYNGANAENLAEFSSNGPAADGRTKPTVTAPGVNIVSADSDGIEDSFNSGIVVMSGTSMATPAVAGAAAMIRQYFIDGFYPSGKASPGNAFIPSAALIKAVIINSAQNMTGTGTGGPIPATGQGWGRINLSNALPFAGEAGRLAIVDEGVGLSTGDSWNRQFMADGRQPFKVTLVWTDYAGATGASKALVNDLDLVVGTPDGTVLTGNAFANGESFASGTADRLNVEEQVMVKTTVPGTYTVTVTAYNVPNGPQPFALAITGASSVSSTGAISLDKQHYNLGSTLKIWVADQDLNNDPTRVEQRAILVTSTTESSGENVTLTETAPNSAVFYGTLPLAAAPAVPGDGRLQVANGDTINAIYQDANDGSGNAATVKAVAIVDNVAPVISSLAVIGITDTTATIAWNTDEQANSVLNYGNTPTMGGVIADQRLTTQHSVNLAALRETATYYFVVNSTDEAGNTASSDAISFTTQSLPPSITVTSSEGNSTYNFSTVISGISMDPSGVASVTINGTPANYRASDGYYSLTVPLDLGKNSFTLQATDTLGNAAVLTISVTRLQLPDLFMQAVEGPPSTVQGDTITLAHTTCNAGPGDAMGFSIGFYLSSDQNLSTDDMLVGSRNVPSLAAGTCSSGTTLVTIPVTAPVGARYLIAYADSTNLQIETNENNNILVGNQLVISLIPRYIITASSDSNGSISPSGNISVIKGTNQSFSFTVNPGYRLANVTVDGVAKGAMASYTFTNVTGPHTIAASFAPTITATAGSGGSITPLGITGVNSGANQTYTVTPNAGYHVNTLTVDNSPVATATSYTFANVTVPHTIAATFALNPSYTITASSDANGSIVPSGDTSVIAGTNQYFSFTANPGYRLANVTVDGVAKGAMASYTFTNVTGPHTIAASFAPTITATAGSGGSIIPPGITVVKGGASQTYTVTPNAGYHVNTLTVDNSPVASATSYTFANVTVPHTIAVTFALNPSYTITASSDPNGSIVPSGNVSVVAGTNQYFGFTANPGYRLANVTVDGVAKGVVASYTFTNVTGSHTIAASFVPITTTESHVIRIMGSDALGR